MNVDFNRHLSVPHPASTARRRLPDRLVPLSHRNDSTIQRPSNDAATISRSEEPPVVTLFVLH